MICRRVGIDALTVKSFLITDIIIIDSSDRLPNSRTLAKSVSVADNTIKLMTNRHHTCVLFLYKTTGPYE